MRIRSSHVLGGGALAALVIGGCFVGCSSNPPSDTKSDAGGTSGIDATSPIGFPDSGLDAEVPYVNQFVVAANAHPVMSEPMSVSSDGTSVTFPSNSETQALKVGDFIAPGTQVETYYIGKITSISTSGGNVTFSTSPAGITDLFQSLEFSQYLPPEAATPQGLRGSGLHVLGGSGSGSGSGSGMGQSGNESPGSTGKFKGSNASTYDFSGSHVSVNTGVEFQISLNHDWIGIPNGLHIVRVAGRGSVTAVAAASVTLGGKESYTSPQPVWGHANLGVFDFQLGPFPIPVGMTLDFSSQVTASVTASYTFSASVNATISVEEGLQYQDGQFSIIDNKQFKLGAGPVTHQGFNIAAQVKGFPTDIKFNLLPGLVFGGPFIDFDPFVELDVADNTLNGGSLNGYLGADVDVGGTLKVVDYTLGSYTSKSAEAKFQVLNVKWMNACMAGTTLAPTWCFESKLQSCVGAGATSLPSCINKSGVCSTTQSSAPPDYNVICNSQSLAACLCMPSDAGMMGDAGNCYAQHCAPCSAQALSCSAPM